MSGPGVSVDEWAPSRGLLGGFDGCFATFNLDSWDNRFRRVQLSNRAKCCFPAVKVDKEPKITKFVIFG